MSKHHAPAEHVMLDAKTTKDLVALLNQSLPQSWEHQHRAGLLQEQANPSGI